MLFAKHKKTIIDDDGPIFSILSGKACTNSCDEGLVHRWQNYIYGEYPPSVSNCMGLSYGGPVCNSLPEPLYTEEELYNSCCACVFPVGACCNGFECLECDSMNNSFYNEINCPEPPNNFFPLERCQMPTISWSSYKIVINGISVPLDAGYVLIDQINGTVSGCPGDPDSYTGLIDIYAEAVVVNGNSKLCPNESYKIQITVIAMGGPIPNIKLGYNYLDVTLTGGVPTGLSAPFPISYTPGGCSTYPDLDGYTTSATIQPI